MNAALRVVIADDEPLARSRLRVLLREHPQCTIVAECPSGTRTLDAIRRLKPDLLFLDVQMPGGSGIEVLEQVPVTDRPVTIFTTAFDRYALAAFELHALDYLLKPFDDDRFADAIRRAEATLDAYQLRAWQYRVQGFLREAAGSPDGACPGPLDRFAVRLGHRIDFVEAASVDWIEGAGDYARLHGGGRVSLVRTTMRQLERSLDPRLFLRIHRSIIVQVRRVQRLEAVESGWTAVLPDGTRLAIGRHYRNAALAALGVVGPAAPGG